LPDNAPSEAQYKAHDNRLKNDRTTCHVAHPPVWTTRTVIRESVGLAAR
jgi:hypothetical protein